MIKERIMENDNFESIRISLASPEDIDKWTCGVVTKPETINYKSLKPEPGGLFCQAIFGPVKDYECHCGKYKKRKDAGKKCEKCGTDIVRSKVRRKRMGRIELEAPVTRIWFLKGVPSRIAQVLGLEGKAIEDVVYFSKYIVIDPGIFEYETGEKYCWKGRTLAESDYQKLKEEDPEKTLVAEMGAEAIMKLLEMVDINELYDQLREDLKNSTSDANKARIRKRLETVAAFKESGCRPEWMVLTKIPVIPPDLRPMVQLDGGRFAVSDLNELYRRVINRNNRITELKKQCCPEVVLRNEKRMLQEAVDALFDNGKRSRAITGANNRALKSLSDSLKGKQGRFRQNLLGKRVDYSGRSVIVVGPQLKIYQCGLPKDMALELFKPFVICYLIEHEKDGSDKASKVKLKQARKLIDSRNECVWDALDVVIKDHPVLLNRAPTLHRLGIQAFEPVLIEGKAIRLHPLVCTAFNADFDGDQMAVHVPLSAEAQAEARFLMLASGNLLKPSDGKPVTVPTQDMILGSYYLTLVFPDAKGAGKVFKDVNEAGMAYNEGVIDLHAPIKIRMSKEINGETFSKLVETTYGKVIFNEPIPQDLGFIDRSNPDNLFIYETEGLSSKGEDVGLIKKKQLGQIIDRCITVHGTAVTAVVLDAIKQQGYHYSTKSGMTVAVGDATIPEEKQAFLDAAQEKVDEVIEMYEIGLYSNDARSKLIEDIWNECTEKVTYALTSNFDKRNPIYMMLDSGARGNESQLRQLAGMRGLIASTTGKTIEVPIRSNYREGLNIQEYFIASRGARKGLTDTALRTADSGYLTRRLVDASQDVVIREADCGCTEGLEVYDIIADDGRVLEPLVERLRGRYLLENLVNDETGEIICDNEHIMTEEDSIKIDSYLSAKRDEAIINGMDAEEASKFRRIKIRSLLTCKTHHGACQKCYGVDLATGTDIPIGEAVGIIAAQSIGEPGTQLTMRTFHTGGVASGSDITQGLPRVEEIFESRKPKQLALLSEVEGEASIEEDKGKKKIVVIGVNKNGVKAKKAYPLEFKQISNIPEGEKRKVMIGDHLTEGSCNIPDILNVLGIDAVHDYIISQVQYTYRTQGVDINDKHIEVIAHQMLKYVIVNESGDTGLVDGKQIEKSAFEDANAALKEQYDKEVAAVAVREAAGEEVTYPEEPKYATATPIVLGLTKSSLGSSSFLSAASFQETSKVLTAASIAGSTDRLFGLKENVIIGKRIPSGTGMKCYANMGYEGEEDITFVPAD